MMPIAMVSKDAPPTSCLSCPRLRSALPSGCSGKLLPRISSVGLSSPMRWILGDIVCACWPEVLPGDLTAAPGAWSMTRRSLPRSPSSVPAARIAAASSRRSAASSSCSSHRLDRPTEYHKA